MLRLLGEGKRVLLVVGKSGSGKSSLVQAGLLPELRAGALPGSTDWCYARMVPGSDPVGNLRRAVQGCRGEPVAKEPVPPSDIAIPKGKPLVLVVDQFEEVFTLNSAAETFCEYLVDLATIPEPAHLLIITVRQDFDDHLARLDRLYQLARHGRVDVGPLSSKELQAAILGPAEEVSLKFDERVVRDLIDKILGEKGRLPLLQFTLLKLWEQRNRNQITWEVYQLVGDPLQALERCAESFYMKLPREDRVIVQALLLLLVQPGEGTIELTSRRIPVQEVFHEIGRAWDRVEEVLMSITCLARLLKFSGTDCEPCHLGSSWQAGALRNLITEEAGKGNVLQIEVAHEALVRNWDRLENWLTDRRQRLAIRRRLEARAGEWIRLGRGEGGLLDAVELGEAEDWLKSPDAAELGYDQIVNELVEASQAAIKSADKEKKDAARMVRRLKVVGVTLLIFAFFVTGLLFKISLDKNRELTKMQVDNLVLQEKLELAQAKLDEHLINFDLPRRVVILLKFPEAQETLAVFPLGDDPDLEHKLARGFVRRGLRCARQSISGSGQDRTEYADNALVCPGDRRPEEQAYSDLNSALAIAEKSGWDNVNELWDEMGLKGTGPYVPEAVLAFEQAREHARRKKFDNAVEALTKALERQPALQPAGSEPELAAALITHVSKVSSTEPYAAILKHLRQASEFDPARDTEIAQQSLSLGQNYVQDGQTEAALAAFEQANKLDPNLKLDPQAEVRKFESKAAIERGWELAGQGETDKALGVFRLAVALDPNLKLIPELEVELAQLREFARANRIEDAIAAMKRAREISPTLQLAEPELANALKAQGTTSFSEGKNYTDVLESLRQAAQSDPTRQAEIAQLCVNFGQGYVQQGQTEAALAAFRLAVELDPNLRLVPEDEAARIQREQN